MKDKLATIVTTAVVTFAILAFSGLAGAGPLAMPSLQGEGAPTVVSYQGQVTLDSSPYDGDGYFKFALVDEAGTTTYWSNDGSSEDGGEPESGVSLRVANGLFNVLLGDDSLENMVPLEVDAFLGAERYLRVWFSADGDTFLQVSPDRRVAAAPYALQAQEAANADTVDGYQGASLEESSEIDGDIWAHATIASAHHDRYNDLEAWHAVLDRDGPGSELYAGRAAQLDRVTAPADNVAVNVEGPHNSVHVLGHTSATIGTDGLALITYTAEDNQGGVDLKVAHCNDTTCSSALVFTLAQAAQGPEDRYNASVTIGADGLGLISYVGPDGDLHVAHCGDSVCSDTRVAIHDLNRPAGATSVTIGADGLGLISFVESEYSTDRLWVAHCDDAACSSATTVAPLDIDVGTSSTSVTIGVDGLGLISYYDAVNYALKAAHCNDILCSSATNISYPTGRDRGRYSSATIGADGLGLISYYTDYATDGLRVAHCSDVACSSFNSDKLLDASGDVGMYNSITVGAGGLPLISYYDATNSALKVAHCRDFSCSSGSDINLTLDADGAVGQYTAVTIGADGLPLISYYDGAPNWDLKVMHCSNVFCTPYFRRR